MTSTDVMPMHGQELRPGARHGDWVWDGNRWVCDWDCDGDQRPPFPPGCGPWVGPPSPPWYPGANGGVSFSQDEPKHVIRGHFWWNGTVLQMFDGAAWVTIGPEVTPP